MVAEDRIEVVGLEKMKNILADHPRNISSHDVSSSREERRKRLEKRGIQKHKLSNTWICHRNTRETEEKVVVGSEGKILLQTTEFTQRAEN